MAKFADRMARIENGVLSGYKKIEDGVVSGYRKVEDAFVNTFIAREGESTEEAKARITAEQKARENHLK